MRNKGQTSTEYLVILAMAVIGVTHAFAPQYLKAMVHLFKEPTAVVHQTTNLKKGD